MFLAKELKCSISLPVYDKYVKCNLSNFMTAVDLSSESPIVAIDPEYILYKCLLIPSDDQMYCLKMDLILEGN